MPTFTVSELARRVGAEIEGDPERRVSGVGALATAGPHELSFFARESMRRSVAATEAGAVLAPQDYEGESTCAVLRVADPQLAFAQLLPLFHPDPVSRPGIDPTVTIGRGVELGDGVMLAQHVVIEDGARIGAGSTIGPSALIGAESRIGRDCRIGHGVSILHGVRLGDRVIIHPGARVGTDGFGYAETPEGPHKIPQVGGCVIGDDVEIGANCTIDRGALSDTSIGARTKLDNLVHVAHNVTIGCDCMVVAQVGIAGSTEVGDGAQLGGQVGIVGHLSIGAGARIAAQAGVGCDIPAGATYGGSPARPYSTWMKAKAATFRLPALARRVAAIERRLDGEGAPPDAPERGGAG